MMNCPIDKTRMQSGIALSPTFSGIGDFHDDDDVCTISPDGGAKLIIVAKCPRCGFSTTRKNEVGE